MLCRPKSLALTVHRGSRVGRRLAEGVGDEVTVLAGVSCDVVVLAGVFREVTVLAGVTRVVDVLGAVVVVSGMVRRSRLCVTVVPADVLAVVPDTDVSLAESESVVPTGVDEASAVLVECVVTSAAVDDVTSVAMVVSTLLPCVDDVIARAVVVDWTMWSGVVEPAPVDARAVAGDVTGRWLTKRGRDSVSAKHINSVTKCVI